MAKNEGLLQIDILGTSFTLQTDETPQYLEVLYNHYKIMLRQVENVTGTSDPLKSAIIAGILVTDELFKEKMKHPEDVRAVDLNEIEQRALYMISRIDQVV